MKIYFEKYIHEFINMLPVPGFDGRKVFEWNKIIYSIIGLAIILFLGGFYLV